MKPSTSTYTVMYTEVGVGTSSLDIMTYVPISSADTNAEDKKECARYEGCSGRKALVLMIDQRKSRHEKWLDIGKEIRWYLDKTPSD